MRLLIFLLLPFLPTLALAQFSITASAGAALPLGDFSDTSIESENAQFAQTGVFIDLQPTYLFSRYIGLTAVMSYGVNGVDVEAVETEIEAGLMGDWTFTSGNFEQWHFLAGPTVEVSIGDLQASVSALAGLSAVQEITQGLSSPLDFPNFASTANINGDEGFTYGLQGALDFALTDHLFLGIQARFLGAITDRSVVTATLDVNGIDVITTDNDDTDLTSLHAGLRLHYAF